MAPQQQKVLIICEGSRGDCQPFVALGRAYVDRGYDVTIATNCDFEDFVKRYGVKKFVPFDTKARDLLAQLANGMNDNYNPETMVALFESFMAEQFPKKKLEVEKVVRNQGYSFIMCNMFFHLYIAILREKYPDEVPPYFLLNLQPSLPTKVYPPIILREEDLQGVDYYQAHLNLTKQFFTPFAGIYNKWREELGIPVWTQDDFIDALFREYGPKAFINGYSSIVVPHPDDYPSNAYTVGYWFLNHTKREGWQPEPKLVEFLESCKKENKLPVFFGFGSMIHQEPEKLLNVVVDTIQALDLNAVLSEGWGTLRKPDEWDEEKHKNIIFVHDCDHSWLLPQCKAAVIHGGAGTTSASLLAGIPTVICPFLADQPFWGNQVAKLGAGPKPHSGVSMTAEILTERLSQALHEKSIHLKAQEISMRLKNEDGLNNTIEKIEKLAQTS